MLEEKRIKIDKLCFAIIYLISSKNFTQLEWEAMEVTLREFEVGITAF